MSESEKEKLVMSMQKLMKSELSNYIHVII